MHRLFLSAGLTLILTFLPSLQAHSPGTARDDVSIEIVSETGASFRSFPFEEAMKDGARILKKYLEASRGRNYNILIRNRTSFRIGVVIAVDGRNIINGKRSELKNSESKYVIGSYSACSLDGWRTDMQKVHKFYFTDVADSYSKRTFNDSSAMGVIAVAVYREKQVRPQLELNKSMDSSPSAGERHKSEGKAQKSAGTGFGDEQYSPAVRTEFEPERTASGIYLFKYEWRETLCDMGVIDCVRDTANRFWDENEFAPFPPNRRE